MKLKRYLLIPCIVLALITVAGCEYAIDPALMQTTSEALSEETAEANTEQTADPETVPDTTADAEAVSETDNIETTDSGPADNSEVTVVWLGDSLTQGSLGEENDNLPNAPYERLAAISGANVEGYGFYGFFTHDILWSYTDESHAGQTKDPSKVYVLWCGSNDWTPWGVPNNDTAGVISEMDAFISSGNIDKYVIVGTIARHELRASETEPERTSLINNDLREHYGEHYLDVDSHISIETGYVPDQVHLTQESYDTVAALVYEKLIQLGYLN